MPRVVARTYAPCCSWDISPVLCPQVITSQEPGPQPLQHAAIRKSTSSQLGHLLRTSLSKRGHRTSAATLAGRWGGGGEEVGG